MSGAIRLDVFGKHIEATRTEKGWKVFYLGSDGKKRLAQDLLIPPNVAEEELVGYLNDLCHELATPANPRVRRLK